MAEPMTYVERANDVTASAQHFVLGSALLR
jgi:hypothetical protein